MIFILKVVQVVSENFRKTSLKIYHLDHVKLCSALGYAW